MAFLIHRVELKALVILTKGLMAGKVSFLIHRVELKVEFRVGFLMR